MKTKDIVLTNNLEYDFHLPLIGRISEIKNPARGDIIVFYCPYLKSKGDYCVKRILGIPGDKIDIDAQNIQLNAQSIVRQPIAFSSIKDKFFKDSNSVYTENDFCYWR